MNEKKKINLLTILVIVLGTQGYSDEQERQGFFILVEGKEKRSLGKGLHILETGN